MTDPGVFLTSLLLVGYRKWPSKYAKVGWKRQLILAKISWFKWYINKEHEQNTKTTRKWIVRGLTIKFVDFPNNSSILQYFNTEIRRYALKLHVHTHIIPWVVVQNEYNTRETFKITKAAPLTHTPRTTLRFLMPRYPKIIQIYKWFHN